jgi:basic amino acid/polyamine antiporter, APA family
VLAFSLPGTSVVVGAGVLAVGVVAYGVRRWMAGRQGA